MVMKFQAAQQNVYGTFQQTDKSHKIASKAAVLTRLLDFR